MIRKTYYKTKTMELRQLKYFVAVAEELHFSKAAEKLFISQSALSQQIQLLEQEIGVALFNKNKRKQLRKVELNEAGEVFLLDAKKILKLSNQALENVRKIGFQQENTIRLGVYKMLLRERIMEIITLFSEKLPELEVKIIELPTFLHVQQALIDETIDIGLTLSPLQYENLAAKNTQHGYLNLIMADKNPLAHQTYLNLSDLKNEKWIEIDKSLHPIYSKIEELCKEAGFSREPHIVQEVSSLELLCSLVAFGTGIAFIPSLYHIENFQGIIVKPLFNEANTSWENVEINHLLAYKNDNISSLVKKLLRLF